MQLWPNPLILSCLPSCTRSTNECSFFLYKQGDFSVERNLSSFYPFAIIFLGYSPIRRGTGSISLGLGRTYENLTMQGGDTNVLYRCKRGTWKNRSTWRGHSTVISKALIFGELAGVEGGRCFFGHSRRGTRFSRFNLLW